MKSRLNSGVRFLTGAAFAAALLCGTSSHAFAWEYQNEPLPMILFESDVFRTLDISARKKDAFEDIKQQWIDIVYEMKDENHSVPRLLRREARKRVPDLVAMVNERHIACNSLRPELRQLINKALDLYETLTVAQKKTVTSRVPFNITYWHPKKGSKAVNLRPAPQVVVPHRRGVRRGQAARYQRTSIAGFVASGVGSKSLCPTVYDYPSPLVLINDQAIPHFGVRAHVARKLGKLSKKLAKLEARLLRDQRKAERLIRKELRKPLPDLRAMVNEMLATYNDFVRGRQTIIDSAFDLYDRFSSSQKKKAFTLVQAMQNGERGLQASITSMAAKKSSSSSSQAKKSPAKPTARPAPTPEEIEKEKQFRMQKKPSKSTAFDLDYEYRESLSNPSSESFSDPRSESARRHHTHTHKHNGKVVKDG